VRACVSTTQGTAAASQASRALCAVASRSLLALALKTGARGAALCSAALAWPVQKQGGWQPGTTCTWQCSASTLLLHAARSVRVLAHVSHLGTRTGPRLSGRRSLRTPCL